MFLLSILGGSNSHQHYPASLDAQNKNTAWLYDVDNRDNLHDDITFYLDYAKSLDSEVLELGCGTGRVSLALAREGINVVANV